MSAILAAINSEAYRAEVQRLGPVMARHELWREATRRALRIADRLSPVRDHGLRSFRFEHGGEAFVEMSRKRGREKAKHLAILEYARDQILAKLERRIAMAQQIEEMP